MTTNCTCLSHRWPQTTGCMPCPPSRQARRGRGDRERRSRGVDCHGEGLRGRDTAGRHLDGEGGSCRRRRRPAEHASRGQAQACGKRPRRVDQVYGAVPPVAANDWLYAVPTVPAGNGEAVEIVSATAAGLTVKEKDFVDETPLAVTWTVKVEVAAAVGVPLSTPPVDRLKPVGSVPVDDQLYVPVPPVAANDWLYAVPTVPAGNGEAVEIESATAAGLTVKEKDFVDETPLAVTWTVKVEVAAAVGVPLSTPPVDRSSLREASPSTTNCTCLSHRWPQMSGCRPCPPSRQATARPWRSRVPPRQVATRVARKGARGDFHYIGRIRLRPSPTTRRLRECVTGVRIRRSV